MLKNGLHTLFTAVKLTLNLSFSFLTPFKTSRKREKMLVTNIFSFFQRFLSYQRQIAAFVSDLNISVLHRLRNTVLTTSTNLYRFCFLGTTSVLALDMWANENPKVDTRSQESNLGAYDCEADALPHDHGHHGRFRFVCKCLKFRESTFLPFDTDTNSTESPSNSWCHIVQSS